jgi:GNAT superfamily N-acetyltransferase
MYGRYLIEKTNDHILETDKGFATYRYLDENKTVYIVDLFVLPDFRKEHVASTIADQIVELARHVGCTKLLGSVVPSNKNSTDSVRVLLAYGMSLKSSSNDFLVFEKEI